MPILIDGYNLLHATGITGRSGGPGGLERSRLALLNFLAASLEPGDLPHTTVVFDAHEAPSGLPRVVQHQGLTVRFAARYESADELIEELIRGDSAPRRLVVVSSDHRIQRAAKRRKAKAIDSDVWYAELVRARRERQESLSDVPARPAVPLLEEDVNYWLRQFGGESVFTALLARENAAQPATPEPPAGSPTNSDDAELDKPSEKGGPIDNPFPPGYGEDLLKDEEL
jgi:uncharacterized protein